MAQNPTSSDTQVDRFLKSIASPDPQLRQVAGRFARRRGAPVIPGLADLMASDDKAIAKAAKMALRDITHYAAQPGAWRERLAVAQALLAVAASNRPRMVRAEALHLLGFVADARFAPAVSALVGDNEVGEDARMALERIKAAQSAGRR